MIKIWKDCLTPPRPIVTCQVKLRGSFRSQINAYFLTVIWHLLFIWSGYCPPSAVLFRCSMMSFVSSCICSLPLFCITSFAYFSWFSSRFHFLMLSPVEWFCVIRPKILYLFLICEYFHWGLDTNYFILSDDTTSTISFVSVQFLLYFIDFTSLSVQFVCILELLCPLIHIVN